MISLETWRGRIGSWAGRAKLSSTSVGPKFDIYFGESMDIIGGISTSLLVCVIFFLLIVSGVEINPGPPRKDINSSSSSEEEIVVPKGFSFGETAQGNYVFSAPVPPLLDIKKRRVIVGSKKRPSKFRGHIKCEKVALASEYAPVPTNSSQISVKECLDVLELSAKVPRISVETQNETIPFLDSQEHQETPLSESQPRLTTAQSKIS